MQERHTHKSHDVEEGVGGVEAETSDWREARAEENLPLREAREATDG